MIKVHNTQCLTRKCFKTLCCVSFPGFFLFYNEERTSERTSRQSSDVWLWSLRVMKSAGSLWPEGGYWERTEECWETERPYTQKTPISFFICTLAVSVSGRDFIPHNNRWGHASVGHLKAQTDSIIMWKSEWLPGWGTHTTPSLHLRFTHW